MKRVRVFAVAAVAAAFAIAPAVTFAQQNPVAPDGTSVNEPPAAGVEAAVDACGNTPQTALGTTTDTGQPTAMNNLNAKDAGVAQQAQNLSSVTGFVVHAAGDLVLLQIPHTPANGLDAAPQTPDKTMAVIRLPDGCQPDLSDGQQMKVVGTPTMQGILDAELVQTTD